MHPWRSPVLHSSEQHHLHSTALSTAAKPECCEQHVEHIWQCCISLSHSSTARRRTKLTASLSGSRPQPQPLKPPAAMGASSDLQSRPTPAPALPSGASAGAQGSLAALPASVSAAPGATGGPAPVSAQHDPGATPLSGCSGDSAQPRGAGAGPRATAAYSHGAGAAAGCAGGGAAEGGHAAEASAEAPLPQAGGLRPPDEGGLRPRPHPEGGAPAAAGGEPLLMHASVASSDLPAVHLEKVGSCRHRDG